MKSENVRATDRHGVIVVLASVMPAMAIISLVPVLPRLMDEFAAVPGAGVLVPMMLTVPALCVALLSPLAGWLADRTGRKRLLVAALCLYAGFGMLPILLTDLTHMIAARVALGMAEAAIMTTATTLIGDYFHDDDRERWIARQVAVVSLSAIVLIAAGGLLGEWLGTRGPFLLYALALPIAAAVGKVLFEPVAARAATAEHVSIAPILTPILITLGVGLLFYTIIVQLGPVLELSGVRSPALIGAVGAAGNIGAAIGTVIFHRLQRAAGPRLLAAGLAIVAAGYAGAGLSHGFVPTAGFVVLACVGSGILLPNMLAWTMRLLSPAVRGRGTGGWTGAFFLGQFVAPIVAGALSPALGGLKPMLAAYAALALAGAGLTLFVYLKGRAYVPPFR